MEHSSFETVIKNYLDKRAEEDSQFATSYAKPNKNIKECCKYIFQEVEKTKTKGERCVAMSDDEVFGMAVHYYDEDDIVVEGPKTTVNAQVSDAPAPENQASTENKPKTRKPRKPKAPVTDPDMPEPLTIPIF